MAVADADTVEQRQGVDGCSHPHIVLNHYYKWLLMVLFNYKLCNNYYENIIKIVQNSKHLHFHCFKILQNLTIEYEVKRNASITIIIFLQQSPSPQTCCPD